MSRRNTETALYEQFMQWLTIAHPEVLPYVHWDSGGINNPSKYSRALYSRLNVARGWPDFQLSQTVLIPESVNIYLGLFLEFKTEGTRLRKRDGTWASDHIREQAERLYALGTQGYVAQFAVGLDDGAQKMCSYLSCAKDHRPQLQSQPELPELEGAF